MSQYPYLSNTGYDPTVYFVYVPQISKFLSETNLNLGYYYVTVIDTSGSSLQGVYSFTISLTNNTQWFQITYSASTQSYSYTIVSIT